MKLKLSALALCLAIVPAHAKIIPQNWKPCGDITRGRICREGECIWSQIPAWARSPGIAKYYDHDDILLSNHGLCNERFHRVVLCLPGWQDGESEYGNDPWFKVCKAWELTR
jgi:hypothetical protein